MATITEEKIKNIISFVEHRKEKSTTEYQRWFNTNTTYGDTDLDASAVNFGRDEAFEEVLDSLWKLIK